MGRETGGVGPAVSPRGRDEYAIASRFKKPRDGFVRYGTSAHDTSCSRPGCKASARRGAVQAVVVKVGDGMYHSASWLSLFRGGDISSALSGKKQYNIASHSTPFNCCF